MIFGKNGYSVNRFKEAKSEVELRRIHNQQTGEK